MTHTTTLAKIAKLVACICAFSAPALRGAYLKFGPEGKFVKVEREDLPVSFVDNTTYATNFTLTDITPKDFDGGLWYAISAYVGVKLGTKGRGLMMAKQMYLACDKRGGLRLATNATKKSAQWAQGFGAYMAPTPTLSVLDGICELTRIDQDTPVEPKK
jgi:hypothetical protein